MRLTKSSRALALAGAVALTLGAAACSAGGGSAAGTPDAGTDAPTAGDPMLAEFPAAAELLPADIADAGVLRVAIPTNEPPTQFYREGTKEMTGINPDIARLVAGALGVELQIEVANFDSIIPGIEADRYDMTVSSMTPTEERMKVLDFVEYVSMGEANRVGFDGG